MTPAEFRAALDVAGLSVREAARRFGRAPATIENYRTGATVVPSDLADEIRAGGSIAYVVGQIAALVERATGRDLLPAEIAQLARDPAQHFGRVLARAHRQGLKSGSPEDLAIERLVGLLPPTLDHPGAQDETQFWLGYHHRRATLRESAQAATP